MHQLQFLESSKWKCISKTLLLLILQTLCLFFVTYLFLTKFCHNFFLWQYIMKLLYLPFAWIISWMISSLPFSLIFFFWTHWMDWSFNFFSFLPYFSLCLLFPSHTPIYTLTSFSNPSLDFFISAFMFYIPVGFIFSFQDCSFLYTIPLLFHACSVFHCLPEYIGVWLCEMFSCFPPVCFVFYLFILVPIFWVRDFPKMTGNPHLSTLI